MSNVAICGGELAKRAVAMDRALHWVDWLMILFYVALFCLPFSTRRWRSCFLCTPVVTTVVPKICSVVGEQGCRVEIWASFAQGLGARFGCRGCLVAFFFVGSTLLMAGATGG